MEVLWNNTGATREQCACSASAGGLQSSDRMARRAKAAGACRRTGRTFPAWSAIRRSCPPGAACRDCRGGTGYGRASVCHPARQGPLRIHRARAGPLPSQWPTPSAARQQQTGLSALIRGSGAASRPCPPRRRSCRRCRRCSAAPRRCRRGRTSADRCRYLRATAPADGRALARRRRGGRRN